MSASLAEVAPAVSTMLLGSKVTLYPRCSDMNLANACGNHAFNQSVLFICSIPGRPLRPASRPQSGCLCLGTNQ